MIVVVVAVVLVAVVLIVVVLVVVAVLVVILIALMLHFGCLCYKFVPSGYVLLALCQEATFRILRLQIGYFLVALGHFFVAQGRQQDLNAKLSELSRW